MPIRGTPSAKRRILIATLLFLALLSAHVVMRLRAMRAPEAHEYVRVVLNPDDSFANWQYRPLENAEVMVVWMGYGADDSTNWHSSGRCLRRVFTTTGADGKVTLPAWWANWGDRIREPWAFAYSPGYVHIHSVTEGNSTWLFTEMGYTFLRAQKPADRPEVREKVFVSGDQCGR